MMVVRFFKELYRQAREEAAVLIALVEMLLIAGGFYMLYLVPRRIFYDGDQRLFAIMNLVQHGTVSRISYSMVGPAFFIPFIFIGKVYQSPYWWSGEYNKILLGVGMICLYCLLRK
ncbi:MAG TPA: hypothetical protein VKR42_10750, partial [Ktedonobacteraceae bacterium]|nr:hypothetical protein [Ktedonobacteraceae bacterium]